MRRTPLLSLLVAAACSSGTQPSRGELVATWLDSIDARFRTPATARWCRRDSLLELFAVRNDTAVGVAILPRDTLTGGEYPVFSAIPFNPIRPQATAAVRWLDQAELKGFEGASGKVTLTAGAPGTVSGTLDFLLRRTGSPDTLRVTGSFSGVPVEGAPAECGRANRPGAG
ncbi:MAG TPA: hypothetical protein VLB00_07995 [Gemmatimonadales bacterium]|jgi:hypothetical protein|nr:hypothetical protein [Gemmatimonadales bacterium]